MGTVLHPVDSGCSKTAYANGSTELAVYGIHLEAIEGG